MWNMLKHKGRQAETKRKDLWFQDPTASSDHIDNFHHGGIVSIRAIVVSAALSRRSLDSFSFESCESLSISLAQ
jgi:hypothetical protein